MPAERVETLVIGGGQAGLAMSHQLKQRGLAHLVLERHRIAERWRSERWDGLRFQLPNWSVRLPDYPFQASDPDGFATSPQIVDYLDGYARQINVPMSYLMGQSGAQNLILSKEGPGRLYYRIGMNYSPTSLQLKPADYGFTVTRVYEAIDDPNDVRRQEDGTWRIKAGAQVRVRLTMVATARRYHVALVDPLPAGFETLNPELAITGRVPQDPNDQTQNAGRSRVRGKHLAQPMVLSHCLPGYPGRLPGIWANCAAAA